MGTPSDISWEDHLVVFKLPNFKDWAADDPKPELTFKLHFQRFVPEASLQLFELMSTVRTYNAEAVATGLSSFKVVCALTILPMLTWAIRWSVPDLFVSLCRQKPTTASKGYQLTQTARVYSPSLNPVAPTLAEAKHQEVVHEVVSSRGLSVANIKKRIGISRGGQVLDVHNIDSRNVYPCYQADDPTIKGNLSILFYCCFC